MLHHEHRLKPGDNVKSYTSNTLHAHRRLTATGDIVTMCGHVYRPAQLLEYVAGMKGKPCQSCAEALEQREMMRNGGPPDA